MHILISTSTTESRPLHPWGKLFIARAGGSGAVAEARRRPCSSSPASSARVRALRGSGLPGPVASGGLRRRGRGVGKPGGGGGLWAAAVGGGDAAGRGRRGDMRWARHRAGERGSELISVGGGGGQRRRRRRRRRSRGRRGKAGARRREPLRRIDGKSHKAMNRHPHG